MNILVCVKQVPDTTEIKIDSETKTLIRKGVKSILNPFDGYALEAAARMKDQNQGSKLYVLTMGPPQAAAVLRECLGMAADVAYLTTDRQFSGSDTVATSYILSESIKKIEALESIKFDAIFCGMQAIDGDTAQVGPQIAEYLDLPQLTYVLESRLNGERLEVLKETDAGLQRASVALPCLLTFTKPSFDPRFQTVRRRSAAKVAEIKIFSMNELAHLDQRKIGLKGSPTKVKSTAVADLKKANAIKIIEETNREAALKLVSVIKADNGLFNFLKGS